MQLLHIRLFGGVGVAAALLLAGCGGGASPRPNNNGPFTVDAFVERSDFYDRNDDRYYDIFISEIARSGRAEVEMSSFDLDAELFIYRRNSSGDYDLIAEDDDSGDGPDALVDFDVDRGDVYRIVATSARPQEFGAYRIFFSREFGRPAVVLPRVNGRTEAGLKLPPLKTKGESEQRATK